MNLPDDGSIPVPQVVPAYFGAGGRQLFGIQHLPSGDDARDLGVVLCHAAPQEYSATYWAMHKLARLLSAAGFHVLRFDYSGTGDSAGESDAVSLQRWADDIPLAMQQLRDASGVRRVALVGMRLGATLALRAVAAGARAREVVMWEPVISGSAYLRELDTAEAHRLSLLNYPEPDERLDDEWMGFPFPAAMHAETTAVDLLTEPLGRLGRMLIVSSSPSPAQEALHARASAAGVEAAMQVLPDPVLYGGDAHPGETLLAHEIPVAIVAFLVHCSA